MWPRKNGHFCERPRGPTTFGRRKTTIQRKFQLTGGISFIAVRGIDEEIAGKLLPRFSKRPVCYERFPVTYPHKNRPRRRMQRRGVHILSILVELVREPDGFREHVAPRRLAELREVLFIMMNQQ